LLILIPADSKNHKEEYEILMSELEQYNPDLLDKQMLIAISKSDMLDDELMAEIRNELPKELDVVFFSSVNQKGINIMKDKLWTMLNSEI
jgi:GTP-binding protein